MSRCMPGEFLAVLGPNGAGKTSLLKVLLGLVPLTSGTVEIAGRPPHRGRGCIGYIPQQRAFDPDLPIRGRDLVDFGLDGIRRGLPFMTAKKRRLIDEALAAVRASDFADAPIGRLSGGEQQRLRIAQALLTDPEVLLCDEPLSSLDLAHQREVSALIDERRRTAGHGRRLRDPRDQPGAPLRQPRALPGARTVGGRPARGDHDHRAPERPLRHPGRRGPCRRADRRRERGGRDERARPSSTTTSGGRGGRGGAGPMNLWYYLQQPFAQHALIASALVAVTCGLIGPFVVVRGMAFAVHGTSELAFTGAAAGLLVADNPVAGALVGALVVAGVISLLGGRERERDSAIGVILAFGLGLGVLLLSFYRGFATAATNILFGDIFGVSSSQLVLLLVIGLGVVIVMLNLYRPLLFASVDPEVAEARGLHVRRLGMIFLVVLALTVTEAAQVVGTLLVLSLAIAPAAAAQRLSASPMVVGALSIAFALVAAVGGLLVSLASSTIKPSVFVTAISFGSTCWPEPSGRGSRADAARREHAVS